MRGSPNVGTSWIAINVVRPSFDIWEVTTYKLTGAGRTSNYCWVIWPIIDPCYKKSYCIFFYTTCITLPSDLWYFWGWPIMIANQTYAYFSISSCHTKQDHSGTLSNVNVSIFWQDAIILGNWKRQLHDRSKTQILPSPSSPSSPPHQSPPPILWACYPPW